MPLPIDTIRSEAARIMSGPVKKRLPLPEEARRKIREAQKKHDEDPEARRRRTLISGMPGKTITLSMPYVEFKQERETGVGK
jgi:hypothetical protein